jgi:hypothetical protein
MDIHSETLSRLDKLQASLDCLICELQTIRSEMRLQTKQTVTRELLTVLEDVAKIGRRTSGSLPTSHGSARST